jgi:AcrR family transcriptional regulator
MSKPADQLPPRERLLAAASRLFIEHGFNGTPVSRIVREAGVTMPVLYYHWGSKLDLLQAVIEARGAWMRGDLKVDPGADFAANCRMLIDNAVQHLSELRDGMRLRLQLSFETGAEAEKLHRLVQEQRGKTLARLAMLFASALPVASSRRAAWLAEVYLSGVQALALDLIGGQADDCQQAAKAVNLLRTLIATAELPDSELPDLAA